MKKSFFGAAVIAFAIVGCWKIDIAPPLIINTIPEITQRQCAANEMLERQLIENPKLRMRMQMIEQFIQHDNLSLSTERLYSNGIIEIPIVVNVIYRSSVENISDAQIQSQITVLNEDFGATNTDYNLVPAAFVSVKAGNVGIRFVLDKVIRKYTTITKWAPNDAMKKMAAGGINPTEPATKLNVWVVNDMGATMGYSQFPGGSSLTDGVVIVHKYFGRVGTVVSPFNKGRTATHEIGHWLNLKHIWGDAACGNDNVNDTPDHTTANFGCPAYPKKSMCTGLKPMMTMNYMDYTNDACMYMFSNGQRIRMLALFKEGGPRHSFAN
jgi:hypothetical protein